MFNNINKYHFDRFFSANGFIYPKDIVEVVQITDLDGSFVPNENCKMFTPDIFAEDGYIYMPPYIYGSSAEDVIDRNRVKATNLLFLAGLQTIKVKTKTVPYSIFYFSSNIDHFLYDKPNGTPSEKVSRAESFADSIEMKGIDIVDYFSRHQYATPIMNYAESWEYVVKEKRSICRGTNLNVYLNTLKDRIQQYREVR